jgi:hypothetical protein
MEIGPIAVLGFPLSFRAAQRNAAFIGTAENAALFSQKMQLFFSIVGTNPEHHPTDC